MTREYYSKRLGFVKNTKIDLNKLRGLILALHLEFTKKGYFQEYFGYYCVDYNNGHIPGRLGNEDLISLKILFNLGKELWPFHFSIPDCDENEIFDIIEFLFDHISAPNKEKGWIHSFNNCGWHFSNLDTDFDKAKGKDEFRKEINEILRLYSKGYQLTENGEIITIAKKGFESLLDKKVPFIEDDLESQLDHAIYLFRNRHSNLDNRKDALRNLADILERLRNEASGILTDNDEKDIFHLINQFGIRHNNLQQKTNYDRDIFYSWMFYYLLSSIHASQHLIKRKKTNDDSN